MDIIGWEAECQKCLEIFNPSISAKTVEEAPEYVIHHWSLEKNEECGGIATVLGAWGTRKR